MLRVVNSTTLTATWQHPLQPNGIITHYRLVLRDLETHSGMTITATTTLLEMTWPRLHPHYSYAVTIEAATSTGYGATIERQVQMPEAGLLDIAVVFFIIRALDWGVCHIATSKILYKIPESCRDS